MTADNSSGPAKAVHPLAYGGVRLAAIYIFASLTALAVFKIFQLWPFNDDMFFFTWPRVWIECIVHPFVWKGACLFVVFLLMQVPAVWGLRPGNKWLRNAVILTDFYVQIFIATLLLGSGV